MTDAAVAEAPQMKRELGSIGVMLLTISALSPVASVYIGGVGVLHLAGSGAAIAYVVGGLVAAVTSLVYAELGAAFPDAGGWYPGILRTVGKAMAFGSLALTAVAAPLFMAFTAYGLASYARVLAPALPHFPVAAAAIVLATGLAILRIRTGALVTGVFLAVEALALAILSGVALSHPLRPLGEILHPVMLVHGALTPTPPLTLALAIVAGVWSTSGASWALYFGEDMVDAERRIGRVTAWSGVVASLTIAIPVLLIVLAVPDLKAMLAAEAPIAAFLGQTAGPITTAVVSFGVLCAIFNNLVAASMGMSRFLYATARDAVWPKAVNRIMATLDPNLHSPRNAALALGVVSIGCVLLGERTLIVMLAGDVSAGALTALAVLLGRRRALTGRHFRAEPWPWLPLGVLAVSAVSVAANLMDGDAGRPSTFILGAVFAGACLWFTLGRKELGAGSRS